MGAVEQIARLSVRLTFQSVVEEIVLQVLGRDRYERRGGDSPVGYRNGFQPPRTIKTTFGPRSCGARSCATPTRHCATSSSDRA